jgi:LDH2 family malate/lactate/ureidoglycolate dehydrogenase
VRGRCGLDQPVDSERFIGTLVIVIDPAAFGELADFKDSTDKLMKDLLAVPAADPDAPVRVPGLRGAESARRAAHSGFVELDDSVWQRLIAALAE